MGALPVTATAFIPARWESSRLPHKNYLPCAGESLVSRAIRVAVAARDIGLVQRVFVSADEGVTSGGGTDDARYDHWLTRGVRVASRRVWDVGDLSGPEVTVSQLLAGLIAKKFPELDADLFCILLPTSPLRTLRHLVESRLLLRPGVDLVMSVTPFGHNVFYALRDENGALGLLDSHQWSRQIQPLVHCGTCLWVTRAVAEAGQGFYPRGRIIAPYHIPPEESADVNTQLDLDVAEFLLLRREALPERADS